MRPLCALCIGGALWAQAAGAAVVCGRVYLDANGNGKLDGGERGLAGVRVTDGVGFAVTGPDGAYSLPLAPDPALPVRGTQPVAVCWPSGRWPTTAYWMRVKDMPDCSKMNFGLRDDPGQKIPFTYLHVTDGHDWRAGRHERQHETVNLYLKEARFVIHTGDMGLGGGTASEMAAGAAGILTSRARCAMPTFGTIGNHDTDSNFGADHEYTRCGGYAALLGPLRFSFDYAGIRFAFADVLADDPGRNDFTAEWLEKDFASLPPGGRIVLSYHYPNPQSEKFRKVIRDHKVELIHAGHTHSYSYSTDFGAPMVTAFARSAGSAGVMVLDESATHVGFVCDGCGSGRGSHSLSHSRRCPIEWRPHVLEPAIRSLSCTVREAKDVKLVGEGEPVPVMSDAAYVFAEIAPGAAGAVGVKVGAAGGAPLTVAFTGEHLVVDGVPMPMRIPARDSGVLRLHVFAHRNMLTVWANEVFFIEKPVALRQASDVSAFAEGGEALLRSLSVQGIKSDPQKTGGSYACGCNHGSLRRMP